MTELNLSSMAKQVRPEVESFARIRVVGVGGSGGNTINHMVSSHVVGVDFLAVNTDAQDLQKSKAKRKIHIGRNLTRGLGTGMDPDLGKQAAEETREEIQEALKGSDMVFVTCGMGGGTGTGAAPAVARIARELGALTVGVVTKPFSFEGAQRQRLADQGITELRKSVDAIIIIPNDKLMQIVSRETGIKNAFAMCDDILKQAVEGISDLITTTGIINVDFADVRTIMHNAGSALMGIGTAIGEKRAETAARLAINSPLLEVSINGAKGVLFSVAGGDDLSMLEVQEAASVITEAIDPEAKVIFGAVTDESLKKGQVKVTVIATGFPENLGGGKMGYPTTPIAVPQRLSKKEPEMTPIRKAAEPSPIIEKSVIPPSQRTQERDREAPKEPPRPAEIQPIQGTNDDDDVWGGFPSFLRRK
jgi:cell division protein FtsZ